MQESVSKHVDSRVFSVLLIGKEHCAGTWPAPPNAASRSRMPGHSSSIGGLAVLEQRVCYHGSWQLPTTQIFPKAGRVDDVG